MYNRRGVTEYAHYDEAGILARTGVTPAKYPQYAALRGDPSDNFPGVPGRGREDGRQADQHLRRHRRHLRPPGRPVAEAAPKPGRRRADRPHQRRRHAPAAGRARRVDPDDAAIGGWDLDEVRRLFDFLEFRTPWDRFLEVTGREKDGVAEAPRRRLGSRSSVESPPRWRRGGQAGHRVADRRRAAGRGRGVGGPGGRSALVGLALAPLPAGLPTVRIDVVWVGSELLASAREVRAAVAGLVGDDGSEISAHDAKALMRGLAVMGVDFSRCSWIPRSPPIWSTRPATSTSWRPWPRSTPAWS